jgi:hypothetical protein
VGHHGKFVVRVEQRWPEHDDLLGGGGGVCEPRIARADDRTRALYAEMLPNLKLRAFPIKRVATMRNKLGIPQIIDNAAAPITDHWAIM